ncbi:MAG: hypothetical protein EXR98_21130 [Gemmataceae bacterium]|nr:hypothetical protein [Gemmataceae bacterium]
MARLTVKQIQDLARSIIANTPGGIRYSVLVKKIHAENLETQKNTIHGSVWNLATRFPAEITKPSRSLFLSATAASSPSRAAGFGLPGFRPLLIMSRYDDRRDATVRRMRQAGTTV